MFSLNELILLPNTSISGKIYKCILQIYKPIQIFQYPYGLNELFPSSWKFMLNNLTSLYTPDR